jgi:uncharacterized coiled-coil DUF342 family protein
MKIWLPLLSLFLIGSLAVGYEKMRPRTHLQPLRLHLAELKAELSALQEREATLSTELKGTDASTSSITHHTNVIMEQVEEIKAEMDALDEAIAELQTTATQPTVAAGPTATDLQPIPMPDRLAKEPLTTQRKASTRRTPKLKKGKIYTWMESYSTPFKGSTGRLGTLGAPATQRKP